MASKRFLAARENNAKQNEKTERRLVLVRGSRKARGRFLAA